MLDISCESSARQTIHMKCQTLFSLKTKKIRLSSATILHGALRIEVLGGCKMKCFESLIDMRTERMQALVIMDR